MDLLAYFIFNIKIAFSELFGETENVLEKKVKNAESYRKPKEPNQNEDEDEDNAVKYDGPNAIVLSKEQANPWEQMKSRLQSSPFIREMLRTTKKIGDKAAETDVGKTAQKIGQNVREKIEVR